MPDLEFRDRLWSAANKLRGRMDAAAYRHVVLALLFLRFLGSGEGKLRVPAAARWDRLQAGGIDAAIEALERANPNLRGTLPRGLDKVPRLDELLDLFGGIEPAEGHDSLGRVYEYFLCRFARAEGRRGGQFYTPKCLVRLLAALIEPLEGSIYDPCCGTGGMFVQAGVEGVTDFFGQESNPSTWRLAQLNLALHGIRANLGSKPADSFHEDLHSRRKADLVLANPPFNQSDWRGGSMEWGSMERGSTETDRRWRFGLPPASNANFAWLQQVIHHLRPGGRAGVLLANGSTSAQKAGEGRIRQRLIEEGWVACVIALPPQLFLSTPIPASAWILERLDSRETLFVDARNLGELVDRTRRVLRKEEIDRIAACLRRHRSGERPDERGFCSAASLERIAAHDYELSPGLYVESSARDLGPDRVAELAREWSRLAEESERLNQAIRESGLGLS